MNSGQIIVVSARDLLVADFPMIGDLAAECGIQVEVISGTPVRYIHKALILRYTGDRMSVRRFEGMLPNEMKSYALLSALSPEELESWFEKNLAA